MRPPLIAETVSIERVAIQEANARLIAAAPDMAALLREVLPLVDAHGDVSQSDAIRAVLSKVDGSTS